MESTELTLEDEIKLWDSYSKKTYVECICPKCRVRHKMNLRWIGRGMPRKYCTSCIKNALSNHVEDIHTVKIPQNRLMQH